MAPVTVLILLVTSILLTNIVTSQQEYENNAQLACYATNASTTLGYACTGSSSSSACSSYLIFRASAPTYQSPVQISYLFNSSVSEVSAVNSVADVTPIADGELVLVPIPCSCSDGYYQHNANYTLNFGNETYFTISNNTFQGLTTCQALIAQNPYGSRSLVVNSTLKIPIRCACPSSNQSTAGINYLLSYLITWDDNPSSIASRFGISVQSLLDANELNSSSTIYPFTTLLVPLKTKPTKAQLVSSTPPPPPPLLSPPPPVQSSSSNKKWVYVGVGVGVGVAFVALVGILILFFCCKKSGKLGSKKQKVEEPVSADSMLETGLVSGKKWETSVNSSEVRTIIESLAVYKMAELERATENFSEEFRIEGSSVYRGKINGDFAAIKRIKGDVSNEINILKHINHSSIVRLSGFCLHHGETYLVYEFAQNGSLSDWIHKRKTRPISNTNTDIGPFDLTWKHRVQIAYDMADGLNYLHNYTKPPYVHKNLNDQNVLLDRDFRAKLSNFGLAREVKEETYYTGDSSGVQPQLTRHVIGTHGFMAPEYLEHGLISTQLDVFAFGVILLELLSGKEAVVFPQEKDKKEEEENQKVVILSEMINNVLLGEDARSKLREFMDKDLVESEYPFDLAFAMAELAMRCVAVEPGLRPGMSEVLVSVSGIYNSTFDWDPSDYGNSGASTIDAR
ncbi:hypothetical protein LUZ60_007488 [Juncus effusus]|nr:hypothetical protein LUZ60_007488 [Juncus effusus]